MAREDQRRCTKCGYSWYAVPVRPTRAPSRTDARDNMFLPWRDPAARVARIQGEREQSLRENERWAICAQCGSRKVTTIHAKDFRPSAYREEPSAPVESVPVTGTQPATYAVGTRVSLQVLGLRGRIGTVSAYSSHGYTVKIDGGGTARRVPPDKVSSVDE